VWATALQQQAQTLIIRVDSETLLLPVSRVSLVSYPLPRAGINHWAIFLQVGENTVKLDMLPSANLSTGVVMVEHKTDDKDGRAFETSFPTSAGPTVQDIVDLLTKPDDMGKRLDKYRFTEEGNGCAFWCKCVISAVEMELFLEDATAEAAWDVMQFYYVDGKKQGAVIVAGDRKGAFF
jgi:hypothetical protein